MTFRLGILVSPWFSADLLGTQQSFPAAGSKDLHLLSSAETSGLSLHFEAKIFLLKRHRSLARNAARDTERLSISGTAAPIAKQGKEVKFIFNVL